MAHTTTQPGLHAHSWNPDTDLLKRFIVYKRTPSMIGRLGVASFDNWIEAWAYVPLDAESVENGDTYVLGETVYTIEEQF